MKTAEKNSQLDTLETRILKHMAGIEASPNITGGNPDYIRGLQYAAKIVSMEIGFLRDEL